MQSRHERLWGRGEPKQGHQDCKTKGGTPDSLWDVVHILRLHSGCEVILQDACEVVLQLASSEVLQDLLPVWRRLHMQSHADAHAGHQFTIRDLAGLQLDADTGCH